MSSPSDNNIKLAALIAKVMQDQDLRDSFVKNPDDVLRDAGIEIPANAQVVVAEDGPNHLNIVVPSIKLAESAQVDSIGPDSSLTDIYRWVITQVQNNTAQEDVVLEDPADAARAAGAGVPAALTASVLVDTDTLRHIVLPWRPVAGTDVQIDDSAVAAIAGGKSVTSTYEAQTTSTTSTVAAEVEAVEAGVVETTAAGYLEVAGAVVVVAVAVFV